MSDNGIRVTFEIDADIEVYAADALRDIIASVETAMRKAEPQLLDELGYEPPGVKYPIQWTSEKQRRFVMAKLREEGNLPYKRTHDLAKSWAVDIDKGAAHITMTVGTNVPYAPFVVGVLNPEPYLAQVPMQQFHANSGWQLATDTLNFWSDALIKEADNAIEQFDPFIQRGGSTSW